MTDAVIAAPIDRTTDCITEIKMGDMQSRYFLICDDCLWVASGFARGIDLSMNCPQCKIPVSRIPLTSGERVKFSCDSKRGVEVEFSGS